MASSYSLRRETSAADLIIAFKIITGPVDVDPNLLFLPHGGLRVCKESVCSTNNPQPCLDPPKSVWHDGQNRINEMEKFITKKIQPSKRYSEVVFMLSRSARLSEKNSPLLFMCSDWRRCDAGF